jgi:hypothetical protein
LLIIQSILVYVKPNLAKELGEGKSSRNLLLYSFPLIVVAYLVLSLLKYGVDAALEIDLSTISHRGILLYASSLVISAFFNFKIATKNATPEWSYAVISGLFGLLAAYLSFTFINSGINSFHAAMILAPLTGIFTLIQLDKRRETSE